MTSYTVKVWLNFGESEADILIFGRSRPDYHLTSQSANVNVSLEKEVRCCMSIPSTAQTSKTCYSETDLGIWVSSDLTWDKQVS